MDHPDAVTVLRKYFTDVASSYYGRPATTAEVDTALAEDPSDDLAPPVGVFLLARREGDVCGCVGVRTLGPKVAELKRMYVDPAARGLGWGAALLAAAEDTARAFGATTIRLDTRHDLVQARALYAKHGYVEIPAYSQGPHADRWYEKALIPSPTR